MRSEEEEEREGLGERVSMEGEGVRENAQPRA